MFLSDILNEWNVIDFKIEEEKEIETFALTASACSLKSCVFLDNEKFLNDLLPNVQMVITNRELAEKVKALGKGVCIVERPRNVFFNLHNYLSADERYIRTKEKTRIGAGSSVHETAIISENNVRIGKDVTIEEYVIIRENTVIGDHAIIRAGAKIGGEGFEFKRTEYTIEGVKHLGGVVIGNYVEIQYNTCVDKAVYPWDNTIIGDYTKVDNLVQIAHAVKIEGNVMVVAQSGIGGRTEIGADTWIGWGATISNGLHVGKNARANIGAVVTKSVSDNQSVSGNFAIEHGKFIDNIKKSVK